MAWDHDKERKAAKNMSIASCVFGIVFLIVWCCLAASMGAGIMLLFGIPALGMMVYRLYLCIQLSKEDTAQPQQKESDPWERPVITDAPGQKSPGKDGSKFCPYCGGGIQEGFAFCPSCGRRQPQ